jgi:hypothetical protein
MRLKTSTASKPLACLPVAKGGYHGRWEPWSPKHIQTLPTHPRSPHLLVTTGASKETETKVIPVGLPPNKGTFLKQPLGCPLTPGAGGKGDSIRAE